MIHIIGGATVADKETQQVNRRRGVFQALPFKNDGELPRALVAGEFDIINIDITVSETGTAVAGPDIIFSKTHRQPGRPAAAVRKAHLHFERR